jgi:hypothetical protein
MRHTQNIFDETDLSRFEISNDDETDPQTLAHQRFVLIISLCFPRNNNNNNMNMKSSLASALFLLTLAVVPSHDNAANGQVRVRDAVFTSTMRSDPE